MLNILIYAQQKVIFFENVYSNVNIKVKYF